MEIGGVVMKKVTVFLSILTLLIAGFAGVTAAGSFNWTVTGPIGTINESPPDPQGQAEGLESAQFTLSIWVEDGVYAPGPFGIPFALLSSGNITISGATLPANNGAYPLTIFPSSAGTQHGYFPNFPSVVDDTLFGGVACILPSGYILNMGHGFFPGDPSFTGGAAMVGDTILLTDFTTGNSTYANLTAGLHTPTPPAYPADTTYVSQFSSFEVDYFDSTPIPVPAAIYLLGAGFVGLAGLRRKFKK
jgi:hypothetical protein